MEQKHSKGNFSLFFAILPIILISAQGCKPAPRHTLTTDEKLADLSWLYSNVEANYAPLEYKQKLYGFDFQKLKLETNELSKQSKTNEEFYLLIHKFISTLRDAHTSGSFTESTLPDRTKIAYLGFSGKRVGKNLAVTRLLPTTQKESNYPIKVGDYITQLDGQTLPDIIQKEFVNYRNLGQPESNLTYHMNMIFNRKSFSQAFPKSDFAVLKVKRDDQELEFTLPWIYKDVLTFTKEQSEATKTSSSDSKTANNQMIAGVNESTYFSTVLSALEGKIDLLPRSYRNLIGNKPGRQAWDSSVFFYDTPAWDTKVLADAVREANQVDKTKSSWAELAVERNLPAGVFYIPTAQTFPTYVSAERMHSKEGAPAPYAKYIAYMYLNTFSPAGSEDAVIAEVKYTLATLLRNGVRDIVIDMINNGGGSLSLGIKLAQVFSQTKIIPPGIQFRTSETWLDNFEQESLTSLSDSEKQMFRNVFVDLKGEVDTGKRLSKTWSSETLFPYGLQANAGLPVGMNIVLLVNEMCASMCDIFTGVMKDNKLATVVGSKTMGAGGNVVMHYEAPNSHMLVNLTESLMVRKDGTYIENNGIEPDVAVEVNTSVLEKYDPVRRKGIEVLTTL